MITSYTSSKPGLQIQTALIRMNSHLASSVTSGKLFNLPDSVSSSVKWGKLIAPTSQMWGENKLIQVECLAYKEVIQPNLCSKGRGMLISVHLKSFCLCLYIVPQMSDLHALSLPQIGAYSLLWNLPHSTLNYAIICKLLRSKDCLLCQNKVPGQTCFLSEKACLPFSILMSMLNLILKHVTKPQRNKL